MPDPTLPLINRENPAQFSRLCFGTRHGGQVFSQFQRPGSKHMHPHIFYVEFPVNGTGIMHEVSALRLAAVLGEGTTIKSFSRSDMAALLRYIPQTTDIIRTLIAAKP